MKRTLAQNTREILYDKRTCVGIENITEFLSICKFFGIVVMGGALCDDFTQQWFYV